MLDEVVVCSCGCGLPAPLAPFSYAKKGWVRGQPLEFIHGHNRRKKVHYAVDELTGCWNWLLGRTGRGYGSLSNKLAHVLYWEKYKGKVPEGLQLDHLCRNKLCVNPEHLEPVTPKENIRRRDIALGRIGA